MTSVWFRVVKLLPTSRYDYAQSRLEVLVPREALRLGLGLPLTWQGWTVFIVWFAVVISVSRYLLPRRVDAHLIFVLVMVLLLLAICYIKGEPPRWRWGDQDH